MHLLSALILGVQLTAAAGAPPADAAGVYARGVAATKAGAWRTAITLLDAALAIDPAPRTYRDGKSERDYYPQYYLFIAHAELGEFEQAQRFYLTKGGFPQRLARDGEHALAKLSTAIPPAPAPVQASPPPSQPAQTATAPASVKGPKPSVLVVYSDGVRALAAQKWNEAIAAFSEAIRLDPSPRTYREGVLTLDYYPQYQLFVAYLKAGDLPQARKFYDQSRDNLPSRFVSDARRYADELALAEKQRP